MVNKMANLETLISEVSKLKDIQKDTSAGMEASDALKTRSNQVSKLIQLIDQYEQQKQVLKDTSVPVSTPDPASKPLRAGVLLFLRALKGIGLEHLRIQPLTPIFTILQRHILRREQLV